jgi:RHS repeat-associated protein
LNRRTLADYPGGGVDAVYHYDGDNDAASRSNAIGRLTGTEKSGAITSFAYDARGNLVSEATSIEGADYTTGYRYDGNDRIVEIDYPTGRAVFYERDRQGRIVRVTASHDGGIVTLAEDVEYLPFGPAKGMTLGNGQTVALVYDEDYRLRRKRVPDLMDWRWEYDARDNVTALTDARNAAGSQTLGYDALNRLAEAEGPYGDIAYDYDSIGNRLSRTVDGRTETYRYAMDSHRLQSVTESGGIIAFDYDAVGNTVTRGSTRYDYDPAGRLRRITRDGATVVADQGYDARGRRFTRTLPEKDRTEIHHYNRQGNLIAETNTNGDVLREYVYLNGKPLAMFTRRISRTEKALKDKPIPKHARKRIRRAQTRRMPIEPFYVHTDHLGTPKLLTDTNGDMVWRGEYRPFGEVTVTTKSVENPLRFPGQHADGLNGLYYNHFRDYDPTLGRYIESDPIGLDAGFNTYGYVHQNPLRFIDPDGRKQICLPGLRCFGQQDNPNLPGKPEKSNKPKKPKCVDTTTNFATCMACCSTVRGNLASGGGSACSEECMRKQGITRNNSALVVCERG